ncbi:MAG: ABC-2 family transporter protein [Acidimicrobiales bacterium]
MSAPRTVGAVSRRANDRSRPHRQTGLPGTTRPAQRGACNHYPPHEPRRGRHRTRRRPSDRREPRSSHLRRQRRGDAAPLAADPGRGDRGASATRVGHCVDLRGGHDRRRRRAPPSLRRRVPPVPPTHRRTHRGRARRPRRGRVLLSHGHLDLVRAGRSPHLPTVGRWRATAPRLSCGTSQPRSRSRSPADQAHRRHRHRDRRRHAGGRAAAADPTDRGADRRPVRDGAPRLVVCAGLGLGFAYLSGGAPLSPAALLLAAPSVVLALLLNVCAQHLFASGAFWVSDAKSTWFLYQKLVFVTGGMLLPLEVLPPTVESVTRWLPFMAMAYAPARLASGHFEPELLLIQAGWLIVLGVGAWWAFDRGQRHLMGGRS